MGEGELGWMVGYTVRDKGLDRGGRQRVGTQQVKRKEKNKQNRIFRANKLLLISHIN